MRALFTLIAICLFAGCGDLKVIDEEGAAQIDELPILMEDIQLVSYNDDGTTDRIVHAERAELYQGRQFAKMENLRLEFYENSEMISLLEAEEGTADWIEGEFVADGVEQNIRVTREDGNQLVYAQSFVYQTEEDLLFTEDPFTMVQVAESGSALVTFGSEMYTSPDLDQIDIRGRYSLETIPNFDAESFDAQHRPLRQE